MLINLTGNVVNNVIEFDLVNILLNPNSSVAIAEICIQYTKAVRNVCGTITSSLIDRSGLNPNQELITFAHSGPIKNLLFTPTHLLWYKIQLADFKTSVFKITHFEKDQIEKIKIIKLKLLINEGIFEVHS